MSVGTSLRCGLFVFSLGVLAGCEEAPSAPELPDTPAVPVVATAEIRLESLPAEATSVYILFSTLSRGGHLASVDSVDGEYAACKLPINATGIYQCTHRLRADLGYHIGKFALKAMVFGPVPALRLCEPMFINGMPIKCTGREDLGDYSKFLISWDGVITPDGW